MDANKIQTNALRTKYTNELELSVTETCEMNDINKCKCMGLLLLLSVAVVDQCYCQSTANCHRILVDGVRRTRHS